MKDILIPLGLLLFIVFFAFAIIYTGRKQRNEKSRIFRDFSEKKNFHYKEEDDGLAEEFAHDFHGIGQFYSPSLGKLTPKDVVHGKTKGGESILFRHQSRFSEGWAREWFVAGITNAEPIVERCTIQFFKGKAITDSVYLKDPVVRELAIGPFNVIVRAETDSSTYQIINEDVLNQLVAIARKLHFTPEIQIRGKRVIAYLADRNSSVDNLETLEALFEFVKVVAGIIDDLRY